MMDIHGETGRPQTLSYSVNLASTLAWSKAEMVLVGTHVVLWISAAYGDLASVYGKSNGRVGAQPSFNTTRRVLTLNTRMIYSPSDAAKIEAHRRLASRGESFGWPLPPSYADKSVKE